MQKEATQMMEAKELLEQKQKEILNYQRELEEIIEQKSLALQKSQDALKELEKSKYLFTKGPVVVIEWSKSERGWDIKSISTNCKSVLGYEIDELKDRDYGDLIFLDDRERSQKEVSKYLEQKVDAFEQDYRIRTKSGQYIWVHDFTRIQRDDNGEISAIYGYIFDQTKLKENEKKLIEETQNRMTQQTLLIQQSKMASMGEMMSAISHQWRQPLNAISLYSSFFMQSLADECNSKKDEAKKYTDLIIQNIEHLVSTMNCFKNFYKPNKKIENFKFLDSLNEVILLVQNRLTKHNITPILPSCDVVLHSIKNELQQVLINIINNSIDALEEQGNKKSPHLSIEVEKNENLATITISDNAGGVLEEFMESMFDPYTSTKGDKGTGIGLYMSKLIIKESLGGDIIVLNKNGGATFKITLPVSL